MTIAGKQARQRVLRSRELSETASWNRGLAMPIAAQLPKWIDWTEDVIDPAIPWKRNANAKTLAAPWVTDALIQIYDEFADDDRALQGLTDTCEQAMTSAGDDVSVRFFVLQSNYWLTRWATAGIAAAGADDDREHAAKALERTTAALAHLTSLLPVEDCPRA